MIEDIYELIQKEELKDLNSTGYLYRHKKTKARVAVISNEDENKVFSIGFRTPPADSTGVPHIIEHSVLCGSRDFPVKDPFVELVKGSLNTFLNAMTYPDKTIYPVASCNDKDFQNLMHVYLDAVFYPKIYEREEIFKQEGWHYELENEAGELKYNGVVYNEMKGVFSSPEEKLARMTMQALFPDTCYGNESGGEPSCIPDLTYEQFLNFHKTYYHPSNSYIYLYGNMDVEEKLAWIDEHYLSRFEYLDVDSAIQMQKPFGTMREMLDTYSISAKEETAHKTYLSFNAVVDTSLNKELYLAWDVLDYALVGAPGAPVKQALLDAGIGDDVMSDYSNSTLQPTYSIIAKNADTEQKETFYSCIRSTLEELSEQGLNKKTLLAALNLYEFRFREGDFGSYPKGLMYGIQMLDSWLYDDMKPFLHLEAGETFAKMRELVETDYFERLIDTWLLNNPHTALIIAEPEQGLTDKIEEKVKEELAAYKAELSAAELTALAEATRALKQYQEEEDSQEELACIPLLTREDIAKDTQPLYNEERTIGDTPLLYHDVSTNGIAYLKLLFDVTDLPEDLIPYAGILPYLLAKLNTENYTYQDLSNEINIHTGGTRADVRCYAKEGVLSAKMEVSVKILYPELEAGSGLLTELITKTRIDDEKRLREIILELKSKLQMRLESNGHLTSVVRGGSYHSQLMRYQDMVDGIALYRVLEDLCRNFDQKKDKFMEQLRSLYSGIFTQKRLMVSLTCDVEGLNAAGPVLEKMIRGLGAQDTLPVRGADSPLSVPETNEGFLTSGQVQYVARVGNFKEAGFDYTGSMMVLRMILSYDYLWNNIRVKGGAYGCMSGFGRTGNAFLVSYRDPNLERTNEVFEGVGDYLAQYECTERDMTRNIIGTISNLDTPLTPAGKGSRSMTAYLSGLTKEDYQQERDELLATDSEAIRRLAGPMKAVLDQHYICVVGNEKKLEEQKELFHVLAPLHEG
ncbi:insulinase family protein [Anaerolentibacter hominis]|uniref:insulinase family protein n=1 Tax=Anaerolentibacter hominis TaxID=3079009 RepID=UPI0031B81BC3